ncbi:YesL family protein [Brevibacillus migulae]|uniref:YesL family protein n=1 Tax=Brevibacillus migulae TaxID=1644114 RepID=UPI00106ECEAF|nr:YesL family protein [Brevibacillus migulae]
MDLLTSRLYRACEWLTSLAYLNLLWIGFILLGGILFGWGPATVAMYTVSRKWLTGHRDIAVFPLFWQTYKTEFIRSNGLVLLMVVIGAILFVDFRILRVLSADISVLGILLISVCLMYLITLVFIVPVYVHYDLRVWRMIPFAFLFGVSRPLHTIGVSLAAAILACVFWYFPLLMLFFSGSVYALITMFLTLKAFASMDPRLAKEEERRIVGNK